MPHSDSDNEGRAPFIGGADRMDRYRETAPGQSDAANAAKVMESHRRLGEVLRGEPRPVKPRRGLLNNRRKLEQYEVELREWERRQRIRAIQSGSWTRPMNVFVTNMKGSSGKTPTVIGLANALSEHRRGGVAAFEGSDVRGTLLDRAVGDGQRDLVDMLGNLGDLDTQAAIESYGRRQATGAVVYGTVGVRNGKTSRRRMWSMTDIETIIETLSRFYPITITDTANNEQSQAFVASLNAADVVVIPTTLSESSVRMVVDLLSLITERDESGLVPFRPELWERTVIVVSHDGRKVNPELVAAFRNLVMDQVKLPLVEIPYDEHIADDGPIEWDQLADATRESYMELGSVVVERFDLAQQDVRATERD